MSLWDTLHLHMDAHRLVAFVGGGGKTTNLYAMAREARGAGKRVVITTSTHMMPHPGLFLAAADEESLEPLLARYGILTVGDLTREDKMTGATSLAACKACADVVLVEADGARLRPLKAPAAHEPVIPPEADAVVALCGLDAVGGTIKTTCHRPEQVAQLLDKPLTATITPADVARILLSPAGARKSVAGLPYACILNKADTPARTAVGREIAALLAAEGVPAAITGYTEEEQGGLSWF